MESNNQELEKIKQLVRDVIRAIEGDLWNMGNTKSYNELKELVGYRRVGSSD